MTKPDSGIVRVPEDGVVVEVARALWEHWVSEQIDENLYAPWASLQGKDEWLDRAKAVLKTPRIEALLRDNAALEGRVGDTDADRLSIYLTEADDRVDKLRREKADLERMLGVTRDALKRGLPPMGTAERFQWTLASIAALAQSGRPLNDDKEMDGE